VVGEDLDGLFSGYGDSVVSPVAKDFDDREKLLISDDVVNFGRK
jgi:hypothetical protein